MTDPDFHDGELKAFIETTLEENINGNSLRIRYREDITVANLTHGTATQRRALRDHLEDHNVACGRGTGESIQNHLLLLLNPTTTSLQEVSTATVQAGHSTVSPAPSNTAMRDFLKVIRNKDDQYSGPYEGPILSTVKRKFIQECDAFEVPDVQRLSVMQCVLREEALRYFTETVRHSVTSVDDAFHKLEERFMTPAHMDTNTTEWNSLKFSAMKVKYPDKPTSQLLDLLFQRAKDLQSMLDEAYHSPILLRDCIVRAVKDEDFYVPLITAVIPTDPDALHTRLHQCIRQRESNPSTSSSAPAKVYHMDNDIDDGDAEYELCYTDNGAPIFKRRIMRGSSSFSTPDYRQNYMARGRRRFYRGARGVRFNDRTPSRPLRARLKKNPVDATGRVMLCSWCNSWFHLVRDCPDRVQFNSNYSDADDNPDPVVDEHHNDDPDQALLMDKSIDEYAHDQSDYNVEPTDQTLFLSLAYNIDQEFNNPRNEYCYHERTMIPPDPPVHNKLLTGIAYNTDILYYGFCLDEGAPQSVTGVNQWLAYHRKYHLPPHFKDISPLSTTITFGGIGGNKVKVQSLGTVVIRMPLPGETFVDYRSLLISNDVSMLLGLQTQMRLGMVTHKDVAHPYAEMKAVGITIPLTLKYGHLYYEAVNEQTHYMENAEYLFSMAELAQVHRNLGHAPAGSVYSALRRAYPIETGASDLDKLVEVTKQCKGCQLFTKQPNRYRAVLPEQCVFNFDVAIDVMFIRQVPILHAVCKQTHFSRAAVLPKQDSYTMWTTFMTIWVIPYLGVPHNLWVDQAKAFLSTQFTTLANVLGCNIVPIAVEAHWSLIAERYHDPLRRIVNKLILDHPTAPLNLIVDYANLAMSHTVGPEGFTPAILAFGAQPRLPIGNYEQQPQSSLNRMDLMTTARREYEAIVAGLRAKRAMNTATPNEIVADISPGDEVLVYREKKGWDGPYTFLYRDGRLSVVLDSKGIEHLFHNTMLKPYTRPYLPVKDLLNPVDDDSTITPNELNANLVEMVHDENDERFIESRQKEYDGIVAKGGVKVVNRSDLPANANFVGNRYVLTIKNPNTIEELFKARWVLLGHHDKLRHLIANDSPMLMRMSLRIILSLAVIFFACMLWLRDVEQAFMQSKPLTRSVFTEAPREAKLTKDKVLQIILPHYGLVESSSCFFDAYYPVFVDLLKMSPCSFDPCFLFKTNDSTLSGITGLATDDSINTGNAEYQASEEQATKAFITKKKDIFPLRFLGFLIEHEDNSLLVSQPQHIDRLHLLDHKDINHDSFRSVRGQLLFISQSSRPDISYNVSQLCQVKYDNVKSSDVKLLNQTVTHLQETKDLKLRYGPLDSKSLKLYVFVDSGYNTNVDLTTQLGMTIFLVDDTNHCHFLHWASTKSQRVTKSMLAAEVYAFSQGYDYGVSMMTMFKSMKLDIPLYIFTDSKSIFDTVTACKRLRELRLMNDIADIRRAYRVNEITNIGWARSKQNVADNFTRHVGNDILDKAMRTGRLDFVIEQWVFKEK